LFLNRNEVGRLAPIWVFLVVIVPEVLIMKRLGCWQHLNKDNLVPTAKLVGDMESFLNCFPVSHQKKILLFTIRLITKRKLIQNIISFIKSLFLPS